jgi:hypothetical protein
MGVGGQRHAPVALPRERDPTAIVLEAGWAAGQVPDGVHKARPPSDRPARNQPLYRLRYAGPQISL